MVGCNCQSSEPKQWSVAQSATVNKMAMPQQNANYILWINKTKYMKRKGQVYCMEFWIWSNSKPHIYSIIAFLNIIHRHVSI
jgi:hypothetical protein